MKSEQKYWDSIDTLPVYYFFKVRETGNLAHLAEVGEPDPKLLHDAWEKITREMIEMNMKDKRYIEQLKEMKKQVLSEINVALSKTARGAILVSYAQSKIAEKANSFDYFKLVASLEKWLKFPINDKEMTTRRFFMHLTNMQHGRE